MKVFPLLCLVSVAGTGYAARKVRGGSFEDFHSLALSSTPLKLDDAVYDELTAAPRNYSTAVLLTALQTQYGCQLCRDLQPEWDLLARSWIKGDKSGASRIILGTLDFANGKGTFQKLMLSTAPILLIFHPTVGPNAKPESQPIRYDFGQAAQSAEQLAAYIGRQLPKTPRPTIVRPVNYVRITVVTTTLLGLVTAVAVAWPCVLPVVQNRNIWAAFSLIAILLFTSGHMFNHIRKVPYVAGNGKGGVSYFVPGFTNQIGLETQIVAAMYGVLSFATVSLALKVPLIADVGRQQAAVWVWSAIMLGVYSFLMSVFRIKSGGYPFWLPPF